MNTDFYVKLQNPIQRAGSSALDELRVSIHRERNIFSTTPLGDIVESGFKIHALDAKRKSQKKIDNVASAIEPLLNKFGEIWGQDDFNITIYYMVKKALESMPK